jgi:hypothetical protein
MDEKRKAEYAAMGIKVRPMTQEEADALGILIHPVNVSRTSKTATPAKEQVSVPKNGGGVGQQGSEGDADE